MPWDRADGAGKRLQVRPDIIVPVIMCCAMLWWIGRRMDWTRRLVVTAITLAVIVGVLLLQRSGF
jgi:low affinity Fe/Cu permease